MCPYLPLKYENAFNNASLSGFELYSRWVPLSHPKVLATLMGPVESLRT